jgi:MOSC domain-containing protein YiiM
VIATIIDALCIGKSVPFGPAGEPSAMHKRPVSGRLCVTRFGLAGDEQADLENHGGPDKALLHYALDHYAAWAASHPALAPQLARGAGQFGENVATLGVTEADICVGDIFRLGSALVQVSQGRQPCWKLGVRFGWSGMTAAVLQTGRTGWYYRVLEEGEVAPGDPVELVDRLHPAFPLPRLFAALFGKRVDPAELEAVLALESLAAAWTSLAQKRIIAAGR